MSFTEYESVYLIIGIYAAVSVIVGAFLRSVISHYEPNIQQIKDDVKDLNAKVSDRKRDYLIRFAKIIAPKEKEDITEEDFEAMNFILGISDRQSEIASVLRNAVSSHKNARKYFSGILALLGLGILVNIFVLLGGVNFSSCLILHYVIAIVTFLGIPYSVSNYNDMIRNIENVRNRMEKLKEYVGL